MTTIDTQAKMSVWRQKAILGTLTDEEMAEAVRIMRGDRKGAAIASDKSRKAKAASSIPNAEDLLAELGDL